MASTLVANPWVHVVGALYHQFILRDGTLARMRRAQD
jgi:cytochrome b561